MDYSELASQWQYLNKVPQARARFKVAPADFVVEEEIGFEPSGEGDQLLLLIEKEDLSTAEVLSQLARSSGLRQRDIGYCGLKDRRSISRQWFSLPLARPGVPPSQRRAELEARLAKLDLPGLRLLRAFANNRKLRRGSHRANHFQICLRDFVGEIADVEGRLQQLADFGLPNYFGEQRFGHGMSNLRQAESLFASLRPADGAGSAQKIRPASRGTRHSMLLSATRSFLFNEILSCRVASGSWDNYLEGDVLNLAGTARFFQLDEGECWDSNYEHRLKTFDIHPCGMLVGRVARKARYRSVGESRELADKVRGRYPELCAGLTSLGLEENYRPLRCKPGKLNWRFADNNLELSFSLESGQYATSLLREIILLQP